MAGAGKPAGSLADALRAGGSRAALALTAVGLAGPLVAFLSVHAASRQQSAVGALAVCAAVPLLVAAVARPDLSVAVVAGLVMANAGLVLGDTYGAPNVTRAAIAVAGGAVLLHAGARRAALAGGPVHVAFAVYALVRLWSALAAPFPQPFSDILQELTFGAGILLLLTAAGSSDTWLRRAVAGVTAGAALVSLAVQLKLLGVGGTWSGFAGNVALTQDKLDIMARSLSAPSEEGRVAGPVGDPNFWAQALLIAVPLAVWLARTAAGRRARWAWWAAAGLVLVCLLETGSRGGLLGLTAAAAILMWVEGGRVRRALWVLPLILAVGVLASGTAGRFSQLQGVIHPYSAQDTSLKGRFSENLAALHMLQDHPLTGVGPGGFPAEYLTYARPLGLDDRTEQRRPHDSYLEAGAEMGVPGFVVFAALMGAGALAIRRAWRAATRLPDRRLAGAVGAALAAYALTAVFLHQGYPDYLWLLLGLAGAVHTRLVARTAWDGAS